MEKPVAYIGNEPYIFASYSHLDYDKVSQILLTLQQKGYRIWYDDGIDPGTEWDEYIATKIISCSYFVAFISKNYLQSENCKDELSYARDKIENRLLIYLEDVQLPPALEMRLGRTQAIHHFNFNNNPNGFADKFSRSNNMDICLNKETVNAQQRTSYNKETINNATVNNMSFNNVQQEKPNIHKRTINNITSYLVSFDNLKLGQEVRINIPKELKPGELVFIDIPKEYQQKYPGLCWMLPKNLLRPGEEVSYKIPDKFETVEEKTAQANKTEQVKHKHVLHLHVNPHSKNDAYFIIPGNAKPGDEVPVGMPGDGQAKKTVYFKVPENAKPGDRINVKLSNDVQSGSTYYIELNLDNVKRGNDAYFPIPKNAKPGDSIYIISSEGNQTLEYRFRVPENAKPGDRIRCKMGTNAKFERTIYAFEPVEKSLLEKTFNGLFKAKSKGK